MLCRLCNRFRVGLHICNSDRKKSDRGHRQTAHGGKPLFKVRHQPQLSSQHLIHKTGCRKHQHDRNEYVHKPYLPAFSYFSISLFLYSSVSTYFPSIRYISLSSTILFLPRQQLYQHAPNGQHQCPAGTRHNLCKRKQFHPFRTAEHRYISGAAHVRCTHPRCDR